MHHYVLQWTNISVCRQKQSDLQHSNQSKVLTQHYFFCEFLHCTEVRLDSLTIRWTHCTGFSESTGRKNRKTTSVHWQKRSSKTHPCPLLPGPQSQYIYIRTVSSQHLLSILLIQFKLVYGPFGQTSMHLISAPDKPGRKQIGMYIFVLFLACLGQKSSACCFVQMAPILV